MYLYNIFCKHKKNTKNSNTDKKILDKEKIDKILDNY